MLKLGDKVQYIGSGELYKKTGTIVGSDNIGDVISFNDFSGGFNFSSPFGMVSHCQYIIEYSNFKIIKSPLRIKIGDIVQLKESFMKKVHIPLSDNQWKLIKKSYEKNFRGKLFICYELESMKTGEYNYFLLDEDDIVDSIIKIHGPFTSIKKVGAKND